MASIWKQGFPLGTDEEDAKETAISRARSADPGKVINVEVIRTDEHTTNNEFLVRVDIG